MENINWCTNCKDQSYLVKENFCWICGFNNPISTTSQNEPGKGLSVCKESLAKLPTQVRDLVIYDYGQSYETMSRQVEKMKSLQGLNGNSNLTTRK